jgi:hypothetical protein
MDWHEECRRVHRLGLEQRARLPYEKDGLPFRLRPYLAPGDHGPDLVLKGGLDDFMRRALLVAAELFRTSNLPAALIQSDARQARMSAVVTHFGWPADLGLEEYHQRYQRILDERFGGAMENLPQHLWTDTIITTIKGPRLMPLMLSTPYHGGEKGDVVYEETMEDSACEWGVLPDWWKSPVN